MATMEDLQGAVAMETAPLIQVAMAVPVAGLSVMDPAAQAEERR